MRPGSSGPSSACRRPGRRRQRAVAAQREGEIDADRPAGQGSRRRAQAKKPRPPRAGRRRAGGVAAGRRCTTRGLAPRPRGSLSAEAQLGAVELEAWRDRSPQRARSARQGEARVAADLRLIDHRLVDRALAPFRLDASMSTAAVSGASVSSRHTSRLRVTLVPVLGHRLGGRRAIGDDEHRPGHRLRPAPAVGDRGAGLIGLALPVVNQQTRPKISGWREACRWRWQGRA